MPVLPDHHAAPTAAHGSRGAIAVPRPLRLLLPTMIIYVALVVALPIQMVIRREALAAAISEQQPDLNPAWQDFATDAALIYTVVLHAVVSVLAIWFTIKIIKGRQWARIALTCYLIVALPASLVSAEAGAEFLIYVIPSDVIHIAVLVGLWVPRSVRSFFAAHRAARRSR